MEQQAGSEATEEGEKAEVGHLPRAVLLMRQQSSLGGDFAPQVTFGNPGVGGEGMLLASHWQKPGILLNILHRSRQPLVTENDPTQNVSSAELERAYPTTIPKRRPVRSCACRVRLLVKLSVHQQSSRCLPRKMSEVGWLKALASKGITDARLDPS